jgi:hypothetical protein
MLVGSVSGDDLSTLPEWLLYNSEALLVWNRVPVMITINLSRPVVVINEMSRQAMLRGAGIEDVEKLEECVCLILFRAF